MVINYYYLATWASADMMSPMSLVEVGRVASGEGLTGGNLFPVLGSGGYPPQQDVGD